MENITYNWSEVESSKQELETLLSETEYLQEYPTPFNFTKGEVGKAILSLGEEANAMKMEMDRVASNFSNFMSVAQITYESLETDMKSALNDGV